MKILRARLWLLAGSACLLVSTAAFGDGLSAADAAVSKRGNIFQLAMLKESDDVLHAEEVAPVDDSETGAAHAGAAASAGGDGAFFTEAELEDLRARFLDAEEALEKGDEEVFTLLSGHLKAYPLYPYLQYRWLRKHMDREDDIRGFLEAYSDSRYATLLQSNWLHLLARERNWQEFLQYYDGSANTTLQCYYHRAQLHSGERPKALQAARELWQAGYSQPKACDPLFEELKTSSLFDRDLFWARFDAAMDNNKSGLARYVKKFMSAEDQKIADLWLRLHDNPQRHLPDLLGRTDLAQAPAMFTHAIYRLSGSDAYRAIALWDANWQRFAIPADERNRLEQRLAMKLAFENDPDAYDRLGRLDDSDYSSRTWRIRVALSEQNWTRVITAIEDLEAADRGREKWRYWLARAYEKTGRQAEAEELFSELASERDFYGYLAADRMNRAYQLSNHPVDATLRQIAEIENRDAFRVVREFLALGRDREAKLQWWHALRRLDAHEIPAAAKLAQRWDWHEIPILTIARVEHWDDIDLRFPLSYADKIHEQAIQHDLDPVILFGLIRRESIFNKDAHSPVGARGLMQLMPGTARTVARELNERWRGTSSLYDPAMNLKYGSYYYRKLLRQFNGHYALALAAYNAGPNRVKEWLPDESLPADIWIETIPYRETRHYVTTVLVYAMIYQQLMPPSDATQLTMNDFTRLVEPLRDVALRN